MEPAVRRHLGQAALREHRDVHRSRHLSRGRVVRVVVHRSKVSARDAHLDVVFELGETLPKTLVRLATRIAAKATAYAYGLYVNRPLGRPQERIKEVMGLRSSQTLI